MEEFVVEDYTPGPPEEPSGDRCPRCREAVPLKAVRCPSCGQPIHDFRRMLPFFAGVGLVLGLLLAAVVMYREVYLADLERAVPVRTEEAPAPDFGTVPDTSAEHDIQAQTQSETKPDAPARPAPPERKPPLNR